MGFMLSMLYVSFSVLLSQALCLVLFGFQVCRSWFCAFSLQEQRTAITHKHSVASSRNTEINLQSRIVKSAHSLALSPSVRGMVMCQVRCVRQNLKRVADPTVSQRALQIINYILTKVIIT